MDGMVKKLSDLHLNCLPGLYCALVWGDVHRLLVDPNRPLAGPPDDKALGSFREDEQLAKLQKMLVMMRDDSSMVEMAKEMGVKIAIRKEELQAAFWEGWASRIGASFQFAEDFSNEFLELELKERVSLPHSLNIMLIYIYILTHITILTV